MTQLLAPVNVWDAQAIVGGTPLVSSRIDLPINRNRLTILCYCTVVTTLQFQCKFGSTTYRTFDTQIIPAATPTPVEIYHAIGELMIQADALLNGVITLDVGVTHAHP